jgi:hypothetical protein
MKLDTDRLVAFSAVFISVCTAIITLYQTKLMRESAHASVMPYLSISMRRNTDGAYLILNNHGIGPAMIDDVRVRYQGKEFPGDPYQFYVAQRPTENQSGLLIDRVMVGRLIPAGASIQMIGAPGADAYAMYKWLLQTIELADMPKRWLEGVDAYGTQKAVVEIAYSSVYGDRWRALSNHLVPAAR